MKTSNISKRRAAAKARNEEDGTYGRRRQEIAAAAARVFNQRGFQGTTISAVAEELHIDRASLYYYISSKDELFDEVIREASETNVANARRIQASGLTPREKLRRLIVELMTSYGATYPLLYIYIRENLKQVSDKRSNWAQQMRKLNRDYDDAVTSIIEQGYADGSFRQIGPARIVAYGIIGMIGWTNRWFRPDGAEMTAPQIGEMYADVLISGLETSHPASGTIEPLRELADPVRNGGAPEKPPRAAAKKLRSGRAARDKARVDPP